MGFWSTVLHPVINVFHSSRHGLGLLRVLFVVFLSVWLFLVRRQNEAGFSAEQQRQRVHRAITNAGNAVELNTLGLSQLVRRLLSECQICLASVNSFLVFVFF